MNKTYEQDLKRQINILMAMGNTVMPAILDEQNPKLNKGKAPSILLGSGESRNIGRESWSEHDLDKQIKLAGKFSKQIGIAIQPANDIFIVDLDAKNYAGGKNELMGDYQRLISQFPALSETRTERTQSGGLHIYLRVKSTDNWRKSDGSILTVLTTTPAGQRRGELLSSNKICIAAPSYGRYSLLNQGDNVITVDNLEACGFFAVSSARKAPNKSTSPSTVRLRDLLGLKSKRVLEGEYAFHDPNTAERERSSQLTGLAKDAFGTENYLREHGITTEDSAEDLIAETIEIFGLQDKADRIIQGIAVSRHTYTPSSMSFINKTLGIKSKSSRNGKRNITPDIAREEALRVLGPLRQRIRSGEIVLHSGEIINLDKASRMYLQLSADSEYNWGKQIAKDTIIDMAEEDQFDHIKDAILDLAAAHEPLADQHWDRLDNFLFDIDDPIAAMFMPKYLIGAITRLLEPGCPYVPTPILVGGQGARKSDCVKSLFGAEYVTQKISSDLGKDDVSKLHMFWVLEMAEVDGFMNRTQREKLKEFLTLEKDTYRAVWKESEITRERKFVFWGNSNNPPLEDPTGNRRYVAISINGKHHGNQLPIDRIKKYRGQLWSRALAEYYKGTSYHFTAQEQALVNQSNLINTRIDSWQDKLAERLAYDPTHTCLSISDAFEILRICAVQQSKQNQDRMRHVLTALGYTQKKISLSSNGTRQFFFVNASGRSVKHKRVDVNRCEIPII